MKNSTRHIVESLPPVEKRLKGAETKDKTGDTLDTTDKVIDTFTNLARFFESPEHENFNLQEIYKNLDDDWLVLALKSISIFFAEDTYLLKNTVTHSLTSDGEDYLNQKEFVDFLNERDQNYSEAKMSVYIQRNIIPIPDLVISATRYWLKDTCKRFSDELKSRNQKGEER